MKNEASTEQFSLTPLAEQTATLFNRDTGELSESISRSYKIQDTLDFYITHTFRHYTQTLSNHPTQTVVCQQTNSSFKEYMVMMPAREHFSLVILTIISVL